MTIKRGGRKLSAETRRKISIAKKGKPSNSPAKFKKGHKINLGRKHTEETKKKISKANKGRVFTGEHKRNLFKGAVGRKKVITYNGVHAWLRRIFGSTNSCENHKCEGKSKFYEWALLKGKKCERKRENYWRLCRSCHRKYDGIDINKNIKNKKVMETEEINKELEIAKQEDELAEEGKEEQEKLNQPF